MHNTYCGILPDRNSNTTETTETTTLKETKHAYKKLRNNDYIIKLKKCGFLKMAEDVLHCADYLLFSLQEHVMTSEQRRRLKRANMCKNRFCSYCNWRRSLNLTDELRRALERLKEQRQVEILFLTLTAKNEPIEHLRETIKYMNNAFHKMQRTKRFKSSILGYIKAVEILGSKTPSGQSHVHFHCLLVVPSNYFGKNYIKHSEWVKMWRKALKVDYDPIVNVQRIKRKGSWSAEKSASKETIKYSIKHTDLTRRNDEDFTHIINQTRGMRFLSTGGILKEMINLQRVEDAEIAKQEEDPFWYEIAEEIYEWLQGDYRLKATKPPSNSKKIS